MLTGMHSTRDAGDRSPFSAFRRKWMSGEQASTADFSREEERRALTASFLKKDRRDVASRVPVSNRAMTPTNDFIRRHSKNRTQLADFSHFKERFSSDRSNSTAISGLSRFSSTERFSHSTSTGKSFRETSRLRQTEISQSATRKDGRSIFQGTETRQTSSVLNQKEAPKNEMGKYGRSSVRERGLERRIIQKGEESQNDVQKSSGDTFSTRRSFQKSVETCSVSETNSAAKEEVPTSGARKSSDGTKSSFLTRRKYQKFFESSSETVSGTQKAAVKQEKDVSRQDEKKESKNDTPVIERKNYKELVEEVSETISAKQEPLVKDSDTLSKNTDSTAKTDNVPVVKQRKHKEFVEKSSETLLATQGRTGKEDNSDLSKTGDSGENRSLIERQNFKKLLETSSETSRATTELTAKQEKNETLKMEELEKSAEYSASLVERRNFKKTLETSSSASFVTESSTRRENGNVAKSKQSIGSPKVTPPVVARKTYKKSFESSSFVATSSSVGTSNVEANKNIGANVKEIQRDLPKMTKTPPVVVKKPIPMSPIIKCEETPDSPKPERKQMFDGNMEEMQLKMNKAIIMSDRLVYFMKLFPVTY